MSGNTSKTRKKRRKNPSHTTVTRSYVFPLDLSPKQADKVNDHITACWRLRNRLVEDRIRNRIENRIRKQTGQKTRYLTRADQYKSIKDHIKGDIGLAKVHSQVLQNVAVRVDEGYKRFFDALKEGRTNVNPPGFMERKKYRSITYAQYGASARIRNGVLTVSKLGDFRINAYRKIKGRAKTVTIKFKQGRWWAIVTAEAQEKDVINMLRDGDSRLDAGVDPGIQKLLTDSEGNVYDPPRALDLMQARLGKEQKAMSRKFEARKRVYESVVSAQKEQGMRNTMRLSDVPYSNRLKKQIRMVATIHTRIERIRDHHQKKIAKVIEARYRMVAVEEHGVQFMLKNRKLARAASDRAIHKQKLLLRSKLGPRYIEAPAKKAGIGGNSQRCVCGALVPKTVSQRVHACSLCGIVAGRDHMASNIVLMDNFGKVSLSLVAPAAGRAVVTRGEGKIMCGESRHDELLKAASESPVKRESPVYRESTTDAKAAVAGKTTGHCKAEQCPALAGEPNNLVHPS